MSDSCDGISFPHRDNLFKKLLRGVSDIAHEEGAKQFEHPNLPLNLQLVAHRMTTFQMEDILGEIMILVFETGGLHQAIEVMIAAKSAQLEALKRISKEYPELLKNAGVPTNDRNESQS